MLQYICIYIIYWKTHSSANCLYLIMGPLSMEMVKQTVVQPVSTWKFTLHKKNRKIKRGLGQKNCAGKKSQRICDEKCAMCAWDHWNSIGANPARYRCEFATSKTPRIRAMCVMSFIQCTCAYTNFVIRCVQYNRKWNANWFAYLCCRILIHHTLTKAVQSIRTWCNFLHL